VISHAARARDAGKLWIAPLAEIADWQQAVAQVRIENEHPQGQPRTDREGARLSFAVINGSQRDLKGLTLTLPYQPKRVTVDGNEAGSRFSVLGSDLMLNIEAGETLEIETWPA
jgi:hypothetical protein